jgi:predicted RNase H-like HicB family nuclease
MQSEALTILLSSISAGIVPSRTRGDGMDRVRQLTAIIEREGDGYVATCPELDVVSQSGTIEEARLNLVEAVEGFFEVASASEIRRRLRTETYVMPIMSTIPSRRPKHVVRPQGA